MYGSHLKQLYVIPISTLEARSQIRSLADQKVILFDFEEANTIVFLLGRLYGEKPPISFYNEYLIRSAETLFVDRRFREALRISQIAHTRYEQLAHKQKTYPHFKVHMTEDAVASTIFASRYVPLMLLYHEIGHILFERSEPKGLYDFLEAEFDKGNMAEGDKGVNFTVPDIVMKIGPNHNVAGQNIEGMKFAATWDMRRKAFIEEAFCDSISFMLCCQMAMREGVSASIMYDVFLKALVLSESVSRIRSITASMPRELTDGDLRFAISTTGARLHCVNRLVQQMQRNPEFADKKICEYVGGLPIDNGDATNSVVESLISNQLYQLSRGAVGRGVMKGFSNELNGDFRAEAAASRSRQEDALREKYGEGNGAEFISGQMRLLAGPHEIPDHLYSIEASFDISITDPFIHGFCCAVRDIAASIYDPNLSDELFGTQYLLAENMSASEILELLRTSRHIAREGCLTGYPIGLAHQEI